MITFTREKIFIDRDFLEHIALCDKELWQYLSELILEILEDGISISHINGYYMDRLARWYERKYGQPLWQWGILQEDGTYIYLFLWDLETAHLENILVTQGQISPTYRRKILTILQERYKNT